MASSKKPRFNASERQLLADYAAALAAGDTPGKDRKPWERLQRSINRGRAELQSEAMLVADRALWGTPVTVQRPSLPRDRTPPPDDPAPGPQKLSSEETGRFLKQFIDRGVPTPLKKPKGPRGPKMKRTQYNEAADRGRPLYHALVTLPAQSKRATAARRKIGGATHQILRAKAGKLSPQARSRAHLLDLVATATGRDISTIRRALKDWKSN